MQAGMGQHQAGMVEAQLVPKQKIEIERARPPALLLIAITAELAFDGMQVFQQRQGSLRTRSTEVTCHQHHGIEITGLVGRSPHGRGVEQRRPGATEALIATVVPATRSIKTGICPCRQHTLQLWPHRQQGLTRATDRARQVGTEGDGQTGGGHARVASTASA